MTRWSMAVAAVGILVVAGATSAKDIVATADSAGQFKTFLQAARAAGMDKTLTTPGPFTVFAPNDAAFLALPPGMLETLLKPENKAKLAMLLSYHVAIGKLAAVDVKGKKAEVKTIEGQALVVDGQGDGLKVNDAKVVQPDVQADNGVIQVIDKVLIPPTPLQPKT
jgi:uncharacterized surface protein with fasciclin (FAS1) repeats